MSGKQYQGTATIRVNGQEYDTLEGATFSRPALSAKW